ARADRVANLEQRAKEFVESFRIIVPDPVEVLAVEPMLRARLGNYFALQLLGEPAAAEVIAHNERGMGVGYAFADWLIGGVKATGIGTILINSVELGSGEDWLGRPLSTGQTAWR